MPTAAMCKVRDISKTQRRHDRPTGGDEGALNIFETTFLIFLQFGDLQDALPHSNEMRMGRGTESYLSSIDRIVCKTGRMKPPFGLACRPKAAWAMKSFRIAVRESGKRTR